MPPQIQCRAWKKHSLDSQPNALSPSGCCPTELSLTLCFFLTQRLVGQLNASPFFKWQFVLKGNQSWQWNKAWTCSLQSCCLWKQQVARGLLVEFSRRDRATTDNLASGWVSADCTARLDGFQIWTVRRLHTKGRCIHHTCPHVCMHTHVDTHRAYDVTCKELPLLGFPRPLISALTFHWPCSQVCYEISLQWNMPFASQTFPTSFNDIRGRAGSSGKCWGYGLEIPLNLNPHFMAYLLFNFIYIQNAIVADLRRWFTLTAMAECCG